MLITKVKTKEELLPSLTGRVLVIPCLGCAQSFFPVEEFNKLKAELKAAGAKEYIVKLGVAASRLESVSLGSERPFDTGQNEEAWAKNRRAHFIVK